MVSLSNVLVMWVVVLLALAMVALVVAVVVVAEVVVDVAVAVDVEVMLAAVGVVNLLVSNDKNHPVPHQVKSTVFTVYCIKSDNY